MNTGKVKTSLIIFWLSVCILLSAFFWLAMVSRNVVGWTAIVGISDLSIVIILQKITSICGLFYIPVAIFGCIGLSRKKDWGYWFSVFALVLLIIFTSWIITQLFDTDDIGSIIFPVIFFLVLAGISMVIIVYLTKTRNRVLQNDPQALKKSKRLTIGLIFGIPIVLIVGLIGCSIVLHINQEIKYKNEIRAELNQREQHWNDNNITDYKFRLSIIYGGYGIWEGLGGVIHGGELESEYNIEVKDGIPVSMTDAQSGLPVALEVNQSIDTIPEMYSIIHYVLDGNIPEEIETRINNSTELSSINQEYPDIPLSISSEYTDGYFFPKAVSIYKKVWGNNFYQIFYLVTYQISYFQPL